MPQRKDNPINEKGGVGETHSSGSSVPPALPEEKIADVAFVKMQSAAHGEATVCRIAEDAAKVPAQKALVFTSCSPRFSMVHLI